MLVTEHEFVMADDTKGAARVGRIRHREDTDRTVSYWEVRRGCGDWYGQYDRDAAIREAREHNEG